MNTAGLVRHASVLVILAMCSACGGSTIAPSSAAFDGRYAHSSASLNVVPQPSGSVLDRTGQSKTFEYIVDDYGSYATIFDYPKSDKRIGKIENVGGQACTNALYGYGKKTFWIVAGSNQITEYAVPKKPIKTLSVPSNEMPSSCALDDSGDLLVGILDGVHSGDIVIFKNASGTGTDISTPLAREYFEGYDNHGNLFFDGLDHSYAPQLDEMPKGTTTIKTITTSNTIKLPGSIQWDGTYLTVTDMNASAMYRYAINGTKAKLMGTVSLSGAGECTQTWIAMGVVFCADAGNDNGEIFRYPASFATRRRCKARRA